MFEDQVKAFQVAARIKAPYYSIDIAARRAGTPRVVEMGDGQVSDIVGWAPERLAGAWTEALSRG
jgi:acetoacetate decarboxylase